MAISNTSPIINFLVPDIHDQSHIGIADASYYPTGYVITTPTVEITPPSFPKVSLIYTPSQLSLFNSNDLGLSCTTDPTQLTILPDGIWTVRMSISPNTTFSILKSYMRTTNIRRQFGLAVMKTDVACCGGDINHQQKAYLDEIEYYIECATAAGNDCNSLVAMSLLQQANKMLRDFIDNKPNFYLNPGYYLAGY
jgi:hypothetical protein